MRLRLKFSALERLVKGFVVLTRNFKTPCWMWLGSTCNKGYGMIRVDGKSRRCHIVLWEIAAGRRVRKGYTLDHLCRTTVCCRPSHMEEVTRSVNTARGNRANPRSTEHLRKHHGLRRQ